MPGRDVCLFHCPDYSAKGKEARRRGTKNSLRPRLVPAPMLGDPPDFPLTSAKELGVFLEKVINETHQGRLDCKTATAIGGLAGALSKVLADIKDAEIESRLEELRRLAASRPTVIRNGHGPFLTLTNDEMPRGEIKLNEPDDGD
jgi:hypothetical protein